MNLNEAILKSLQKEGGYVNDPNDRGGETYRGIARKFHPTWVGWRIIDKISDKKTGQIFKNSELDKLVLSFYNEYLKDIKSEVLKLDQVFGNKVVGIAINVGVPTAKELLRKS